MNDMSVRMYAVYIMTNEGNTVLYTGVTNDLKRRVREHRMDLHPGSFTARYRLHKLVYYDVTTDIHAAIAYEKKIKAGPRRKKIELIENMNHEWTDLFDRI